MRREGQPSKPKPRSERKAHAFEPAPGSERRRGQAGSVNTPRTRMFYSKEWILSREQWGATEEFEREHGLIRLDLFLPLYVLRKWELDLGCRHHTHGVFPQPPSQRPPCFVSPIDFLFLKAIDFYRLVSPSL